MGYKSKVIIFTAPSGSGKGSILSRVLPLFKNIAFSVSATTRAPRKGEINHVHYHFITVEQFQNHIKNNDFLEWEEVYEGTFYGTLKSETYQLLNQGKHVLFEVDVKGALSIKKYFQNRALSIFIQPPSLEELKKRLIERGTETEITLQQRLKKAETEIMQAHLFDKVVINDDLEAACQKVEKILRDFIGEQNEKTPF
ncbi:MAG: guanylate kinase [Bacteroidia bacterium]|nr:guanylate kinase [Bacteroidia bacterium]MDW8302716.1 guanylate kinase [Bacteroidia bacterium]